MTTSRTAHPQPVTSEPVPPPTSIRWGWLTTWALLTAFATFEVVKHGYIIGSAIDAVALTAAAVTMFIALDRAGGYGLRNPDGSRSQ